MQENMKNEYSAILGNNIKKYREMNKMTQIELAEKLNVKQSTISQYENGDRDPSTQMIYKLCEILQIDFNELYNII